MENTSLGRISRGKAGPVAYGGAEGPTVFDGRRDVNRTRNGPGDDRETGPPHRFVANRNIKRTTTVTFGAVATRRI